MKRFSKLIAMLLVVVSAISLAACSSKYGALKKAFEEKGYTESEQVETWSETIKNEIKGEDGEMVTNIHVFTKANFLASDVVLILEFKATDDMLEFYKESKTFQGAVADIKENDDAKAFYNALVDAGYANGNCLVFSTNPLNMNEVTTIVKGA